MEFSVHVGVYACAVSSLDRRRWGSSAAFFIFFHCSVILFFGFFRLLVPLLDRQRDGWGLSKKGSKKERYLAFVRVRDVKLHWSVFCLSRDGFFREQAFLCVPAVHYSCRIFITDVCIRISSDWSQMTTQHRRTNLFAAFVDLLPHLSGFFWDLCDGDSGILGLDPLPVCV